MVIRLWSCRINGYDLTVGEEFSGSPAGDSFPGSDFMTAAIVLICSTSVSNWHRHKNQSRHKEQYRCQTIAQAQECTNTAQQCIVSSGQYPSACILHFTVLAVVLFLTQKPKTSAKVQPKLVQKHNHKFCESPNKQPNNHLTDKYYNPSGLKMQPTF